MLLSYYIALVASMEYRESLDSVCVSAQSVKTTKFDGSSDKKFLYKKKVQWRFGINMMR